MKTVDDWRPTRQELRDDLFAILHDAVKLAKRRGVKITEGELRLAHQWLNHMLAESPQLDPERWSTDEECKRDCDSVTLKELLAKYPEEFNAWLKISLLGNRRALLMTAPN